MSRLRVVAVIAAFAAVPFIAGLTAGGQMGIPTPAEYFGVEIGDPGVLIKHGKILQYYQNLGEFLAESHQLEGRSLRVHGYVALGSIQRDVASKQVHFAIVNDPPHAGGGGPSLPVIFASLETPDLFKDGSEVVVEGSLASVGGPFRADKVMAKCPSKFEAADPTQQQASY